MYIPDNYAAFLQHDARCAVQEQGLPRCCSCGSKIYDDMALNVQGNWYCESCKDEFYEVCEQLFTKDVMLEEAV